MGIFNDSLSDIATASKYVTSEIADVTKSVTGVVAGVQSKISGFLTTSITGRPRVSATPVSPASANVKFASDALNTQVMLMVPYDYLTSAGISGILYSNGGIMFPYTPSMSQESVAEYASLMPVHSNFKQQFYKSSYTQPITLSAKFSAQNTTEASIITSTILLLRSLTKMKWGDEAGAGSPPPVCRLMAYGNGILDNTPVAVQTFKYDLPESGVDYISDNDNNSVPTLLTISLTLLPIWSRNEQQKFTVAEYLNGRNNSSKEGYL